MGMITRIQNTLLLITGIYLAGPGCAFESGSTGSALGADDLVEDAGGTCPAEEPDLIYNLDVQCGESVIPVLAAFRAKSGPDVAFAPIEGTPADCPFLIEGAAIHADEVASCQPFTASADDATASGSKDIGEDRIWVTWCWYTGLSEDDTGCCLAEDAVDEIECETDHMTIRYACDGGESELVDGADLPLTPSDAPASCQCSDPDGCEPGDGGDGDDGDGDGGDGDGGDGDGGDGDGGDGCQPDIDTGSCLEPPQID